MASTVSDFEVLLTNLCEAHGFTVVSVGINLHQAADYLYSAALHYDGPLDGIGCSHGNGPTLTAALNDANRNALKNRPEQVLVQEAA